MTGRITFQPRLADGFAARLRLRADVLLDDPRILRRGHLILVGKGLFFAGCSGIAYAALLLSGGVGIWAWASVIGFGLASLLLAINIGHDAAHGTLFRRPWLNHLVQFLTFAPLGVDAYLWRFRHIASHHVFPNVSGSDIDIDENPFLRLSPNQPWKRRFRFQHLYAPAIYALVALHSAWVQDFAYLFKRQLANARNIRHSRAHRFQFFLGKGVHLALWFGLPLALTSMSAGRALALYVVGLGVMSLVFVFLLVGTHFSTAAAFPTPDSAGRLPLDFAGHAVATSVDWSPESRLAGFIAGGANTHAAHHLFPRVAHVHYRALNTAIRECAAECALDYHCTSLPGMIADHLRFLRRLGTPPASTSAS
ncbi:fatty acid desaturase family protein [Zavarzinia aquatilis]|uniref:Fatty acid desaturase domain-containing protein n=1 Tax=Zavarzinia aquatilis TaxID=2211142 RepID=A0A317E8X2_9PROT|nr:acyl-CoA desaturase [Zavarzinia aquatilis]PWR22650.1 hypothetical protein DKG74_12340 [Zavarzinia aquatilis]